MSAADADEETPITLWVNDSLGWSQTATVTLTIVEAAPRTLYVNDDATGAETGASWADAYRDLQVALTTAKNNYLKAMYEYNNNRSKLDKAMGVPVK